MKGKIISSLVFVALLTYAGNVLAIPFGFTQVTSNGPVNVSDQLIVDVANAGSGESVFTFTNTGNLASFISQIYFDFGTLTPLIFGGFSNFGNVSYVTPDTPANLPGGGTFDSDWNAGPTSPGTGGDGIDNWTGSGTQDSLSISFTGPEFSAILTALNDRNLRIGLHVQGIGNYSESYINTTTPVPEPASMLLFGTGLISLAGVASRKRNKK